MSQVASVRVPQSKTRTRSGLARTIRRAWSGQTIALGLLIVWATLSLFPVYWLMITSLKGQGEIGVLPPSMWVKSPTLENYVYIFSTEVPFVQWLWNSTIVSIGSTVGTLLVCSLAGYSFARKRFWGRDALFWSLIATMLIPGWSTLVPSLVWVRQIGLLDTYWVLILPQVASPFAVFLMRQFLVTQPSELFDAARVDGCGEIGLWWRIAMPLAKPVLAALGTFVFIGTWNDFLWPLVVINKASMFTAQVGVVTMRSLVFMGGMQYGFVMATAVVLSLPPILAFLVMQRQLVRGITVGALKG